MDLTHRSERSIPGVVAAGTAFLLPVAYSPSVNAPFWSPKAAVLLAAGGFGLPLLPRLWRSSLRPAAIAATVFLTLACMATVASPEPVMALVGPYNWGTGLLFVAALVGCWSLGAHTNPDDRRLLLVAMLGGIAVTGAVAVLQTFVSVGVASLDGGGRLAGLSGNAVHLGAVMAAAAAVVAWHATSSWRWGVAAIGPAAVIQLTGTRFALVLLAAIAIAGAVRAGWRRGGLLVGAVAVGLALGSVMASASDVQTAVGRAADDGSSSVLAGGGSTVRLDVWTYSLGAIGERPLLGSGPGRFRAATSADRTLRVARLEGGDSIYSDGHNLVVEHAVTVGLPATAALSLWLLFAFRRARGALAGFALALLGMSLVQPLSVGTTPLLFLALGAAGPAAARRDGARWTRLLPSAIGIAVGSVAAVVLLAGDFRLNQARLDFDLAHGRAADQLLRPWPEPATILARAHSFLALSGASTAERAVQWRAEAVRRDPTEPSLRVLLGDELQDAGETDAARKHYELALEHNPYSASALERLATLAEARGDRAQAVEYLERALEVRPVPSLERRLHRLREDA